MVGYGFVLVTRGEVLGHMVGSDGWVHLWIMADSNECQGRMRTMVADGGCNQGGRGATSIGLPGSCHQ